MGTNWTICEDYHPTSTDFVQCKAIFQHCGNDPKFAYVNNTPSRISTQGCRDLCGTGNDYYEWKDSSATITTWVLPVIGLLLQAPYESNEFRRTLRALARWIGSPIASLSYTLWNIKVTGKCALMVDMATKYGEIPCQDSQFAQMRDSLYLLSVMNQCM